MPLKILLADDSLTAQNMGKKILTDAGYEVIAVSNGAQAMKKIVAERPDLVVLDIYMPGYSGLEVCERMRNSRETADTPVLLSVGKMEPFKPEEAVRVRADGVIIKPFEATELVATMKKLAESLSPVLVAKQPPQQAAPELEPVEDVPAPVDSGFEIQSFAVQIPHEFASAPAFGIDLIPEELHEPAAPIVSASATDGLIEFEVEHDSEPIIVDPGLRMASAAGLSGVFEIAPSSEPTVPTPVEPMPAEEFERFAPETHATPAPSAENAEFVAPANEFPGGEPQAFVSEEPIESFASSEPQTWPAAETSPSEYGLERFGHGQPEASLQSADSQAPQSLPELTPWEEPTIQASPGPVDWSMQQPETFAADASHLATELQTDSAAEHASVDSVWIAEEAEIEPHEVAISLHEQMQQGASVSEMSGPEPVAAPAAIEEASFESWEAPEPLAEEPEQQSSEPSAPEQAQVVPEHGSFPVTAAAEEQPELQSAQPEFSSTEFPAHLEASAPDPAAEPVPVPDYHPNNPMPEPADFAFAADLEPEPPAVLPTIIEAPVDPVRIARIVDQLIERLKPELIAAVTRELEHKDS